MNTTTTTKQQAQTSAGLRNDLAPVLRSLSRPYTGKNTGRFEGSKSAWTHGWAAAITR